LPAGSGFLTPPIKPENPVTGYGIVGVRRGTGMWAANVYSAFIGLASRDRDVQNDADFIIDSRVLLVSRLQLPIELSARQ
jgi:hypothetical protein